MKSKAVSWIMLMLGLMGMLALPISLVAAEWALVPNGSFESGTVGLVPDSWVMVTRNHGPENATYINEIEQTDQEYFEGSKSLWMHSRIVDTDGLKRSRAAWTEAVTEDWIDASSATHVRIYIRDIKSTHSTLGWGWANNIFLRINNVSVARTYCAGSYYGWIFTHGETCNFNQYNYTAVGADGEGWYVYEYSIPESVDKNHMKIQIVCDAGDWTFYDTSYFSDLEFVVDKVELYAPLYRPPNWSFEEGVLCTVPDHWLMKTLDRDGVEPVPNATYIHEVCENDTHYFSGDRSCWLHSRVVDTDGTVASRGCWTWIETEDWINASDATHIRFYIRDIQPTHSPLHWGWNNGIYLAFNDTVAFWRIMHLYNDGETLNFHYYNDTKIGADGATWYEYIYPIPADINKSHMKILIICFAGDWTFYDTSYFADLKFYVDNVELLILGQSLTIDSSPTGVTFTVDGVPQTTLWSGTYGEGSSVSLVMPETHTVGDTRYCWDQWSDGVTSRSRTVIMNTSITLTAYFTGPCCLTDINCDGIVDIVDGVIIGVAFGSRPGDPNWNPIADIAPVGTPDNLIDIQDIVLWAMHFGEDC